MRRARPTGWLPATPVLDQAVRPLVAMEDVSGEMALSALHCGFLQGLGPSDGLRRLASLAWWASWPPHPRTEICDQESIVHPPPDNVWNRATVTSAHVAVLLEAGLPDPGTKPYLRTGEVAELLHAAPKTVSNWAMQGKLPYARTLGGHRRYPTSQILTLAASLTSTLLPAPPTPARHGGAERTFP